MEKDLEERLKGVVPYPAGFEKILVNGKPFATDFRVIADDLFKDVLSELEAVKAELALSEKALEIDGDKMSLQGKEIVSLRKSLMQAETERDELKAKLAESDLVSRKELLEWVEGNKLYSLPEDTSERTEGYNSALNAFKFHLTQPKEGESEKLKCHHQYMNAGTLQGDAMKKCLKCGNYVKAL